MVRDATRELGRRGQRGARGAGRRSVGRNSGALAGNQTTGAGSLSTAPREKTAPATRDARSSISNRSTGDNRMVDHEILSVSALTLRLKALVENGFPHVCVEGEISNLSRATSGHVYLTLKDETAQIRAVLWRSAAARIRFELHDGLHVVAAGPIEVYAARGSYQIVIERLAPQGIGPLELAFRQRYEKLAAEGLFRPERKRPAAAVSAADCAGDQSGRRRGAGHAAGHHAPLACLRHHHLAGGRSGADGGGGDRRRTAIRPAAAGHRRCHHRPGRGKSRGFMGLQRRGCGPRDF